MAERSEADEIGATGEAYFDLIMTKTDLLFGKIDPDRLGKDRVIEAQLSSWEEGLPYDERSAPLSCAVQIKTVKNTTNRVSLTLSVAQRLAHGPLPAFIYIIRLDEDRETIETKVIHIIGEPLRRILQRLRQATKDKLTDLNKSEITFAISDARCIGMKGRDLKEYLMGEIGLDMDIYVQRKMAERKEGYVEGRPKKITWNFSKTAPSDLADITLGIRPLPLSDFMAEEERFGVALPTQLPFPLTNKEQIPAFIIPKAHTRCFLVFQAAAEGEKVELECEVFLPWWQIEGAPKFLVTSSVLKGEFEGGYWSHELIFELARPLQTWVKYFQIMSIMSRERYYLSVRGLKGFQGSSLRNGSSDTSIQEMTGDAINALCALRDLRAAAGVDVNGIVNLDELQNADEEILLLRDMLAPAPSETIEFQFSSSKTEAEAEKDFIIVRALSCGKECYAAVTRSRIKIARSEECCSATSISPIRFVDIVKLSDFGSDLYRQFTKIFRLTDADCVLVSYTYASSKGTARTIGFFDRESISDWSEEFRASWNSIWPNDGQPVISGRS